MESLLEPREYGYDANGNLVSVTTQTPDCVTVERLMSWGADNRLRWVSAGNETTSYRYDADGQRSAKTGPSGTTHYFGNLFEVEDPAGAARLVKYYYAGDLLLARQENGARVWYHQDHLGSVRAMTDNLGAPQVEYEYAAFGDAIETTGAADNLRGFGAHWRDDESHLVYMGARYQDPVLGRFTQPDPVIPEPGDPQSWNRYSYVRNNPFNRIDPTGNVDILGVENVGTRALGGLQFFGGIAEVGIAGVLGGSTGLTGIGAIGAAALATHGTDAAFAGFKTALTGEFQAGLTPQILEAGGMSSQAAGLADASISIFGGGAAGLAAANRGASSAVVGVAEGSVDDLLKGATKGKTGKTQQFRRSGDAADANQAFDRLAGGNKVTDQGGGVRSTTLSDGSTASVRPSSSGGQPTIQVNPSGDSKAIKVRFQK